MRASTSTCCEPSAPAIWRVRPRCAWPGRAPAVTSTRHAWPW